MPATAVTPRERFDALVDELAELAGQRNAIDGRVVEIVAEIERDELWGGTGARSIAALVAWKLGTSSANAHTIAAVAHRSEAFPRCVGELRQGRLSLDQVGVIAARAADGSDDHYVELARYATVSQLRTAVSLEPQPDPQPRPPAQRSITRTAGEHATNWKITLPHDEAAAFDAALQSHLDALITAWKNDHADDDDRDGEGSGGSAPMPSTVDAFLALVDAGWDADAARRPHAHRTTVVVHVDVERRVGALHRGPLLSDADRQYLTCDATCEVWFERAGRVIGAGRATRTVNRRLRRALEHRDRTCVVPGCEATRALHAHHLHHWEDGGPTDLDNLVLVCPFHHRAHHRGDITLSGTAHALVVTDEDGDPLTSGAIAHAPNAPPPAVPPCRGPLGERADWWWYQPFDPTRPSTN